MASRNGWGVPLAEHPTGTRVCKSAKEPPTALRAARERSQAEPGLPTATDVWRCAEDCGLVVDGADGKPRLEDDYSIKPCAPDPGRDAEPGSDRSLQKT